MWEQMAKKYYLIATWFATNEPGTPVPDWCDLSWPPTEIKELIHKLEHKNMLAREELKRGVCFSHKLLRAIKQRENKIQRLLQEIE